MVRVFLFFFIFFKKNNLRKVFGNIMNAFKDSLYKVLKVVLKFRIAKILIYLYYIKLKCVVYLDS